MVNDRVTPVLVRVLVTVAEFHTGGVRSTVKGIWSTPPVLPALSVATTSTACWPSLSVRTVVRGMSR